MTKWASCCNCFCSYYFLCLSPSPVFPLLFLLLLLRLVPCTLFLTLPPPAPPPLPRLSPFGQPLTPSPPTHPQPQAERRAKTLLPWFVQRTMFLFSSYVLTGTEKGMKQTFGTTCHGAVSDCLYIETRWSDKNFYFCERSFHLYPHLCLVSRPQNDTSVNRFRSRDAGQKVWPTVVMKLSRTSNFIGSCWHEALIVLGLASIVTIVSTSFSQPILWDVPNSFVTTVTKA